MMYIQLAAAPVIVILAYIYYRDKYNKEPFWLLFFLFISGMFSVLPVLGVGYISDAFIGYFRGLYRTAYTAFIQAAFIEEFWKLFFTFLIAWWAKSFDERFDGIVYAVTVSMGFALVENIMYVTGYGYITGLLRIVTAVPAHAIFGIAMGYYLGKAKFDKDLRVLYLFLAFIVPWLIHGIYDFLIMSGITWMVIAFIVFLILMYIFGFIRLKQLARYKVKPAEVNSQNENMQNDSTTNFNVNTDGRGFEQNQNADPDNDTFADAGYEYNTDAAQASNQANVEGQNQYVPPPSGYQHSQTNNQFQTQTPNRGFQTQIPPKNNLETLAILHYVWGGLKIFASLFILIYVLMGIGMVAGGVYEGDFGMQFAGGMFLVFGGISFLLVVAIGILNILCGRYLQQKKNRVFCIVMSALACMNAPLGTLLGIFTIIEIEKPEIKAMFETKE